jgi:hypothetical protein
MLYRKPEISRVDNPTKVIQGQGKFASTADLNYSPPRPNTATSGAYEADE